MTTFIQLPNKHLVASIALMTLMLSACQSTQEPATTTQPTPITEQNATEQNIAHQETKDTAQTAPSAFSITGKIGITTQTVTGRQAGSAFYTWSQEKERFAIELNGALGMGTTTILYNGTVATLNSEKTGLIEADSPEALLLKATGWHAPISELRYWIIGQTAPNDTNPSYDPQNRLIASTQGAWSASFSYQKGTLPHRLTITHTDGHRIIMTIFHSS